MMKVFIVKKSYELDGEFYEDCIRVFKSSASAEGFIKVQELMDEEDEEHGCDNAEVEYFIETCEMED